MPKVRDGGESVRKFLIENIGAHPSDVVRLASDQFSCSRQAIHKHLQRLIEEGAVAVSGNTRSKRYVLAPLAQWEKRYPLVGGLAEDAVWRVDILPQLDQLPSNALDIWHYGFTEMFNNAIDHSGAESICVRLHRTAATTDIHIEDDGVGIFKKIQASLGLADERHAVLELAKGKCTTDPANHSGEGIFFSSLIFDEFAILSGEVFFSHQSNRAEDWILQHGSSQRGTQVRMVLRNHTAKTSKEVFDQFTDSEDYGFNKTVVPVSLMQYGDENLVSRSQAKRLLVRFDRFKVIVLDFSGVATIGQGFADEVFRVFQTKYPGIKIVPIHCSAEVEKMISRAKVLGASEH